MCQENVFSMPDAQEAQASFCWTPEPIPLSQGSVHSQGHESQGQAPDENEAWWPDSEDCHPLVAQVTNSPSDCGRASTFGPDTAKTIGLGQTQKDTYLVRMAIRVLQKLPTADRGFLLEKLCGNDDGQASDQCSTTFSCSDLVVDV